MGKWITRILTVVLVGVFVFSGWKLLSIRSVYSKSEKVYSGLANEFTSQQSSYSDGSESPRTGDSTGDAGAEFVGGVAEPSSAIAPEDRVPIMVDFEKLLEINQDIIGWIYCEGSVINYPVVHCGNNDYYLEHNIKHESDPCGTIFADRSNHKGIVDSNIILYGHHMQNMSMFATLKYWREQAYYDEHPVMWLLTPEGDYRVELFSCYETSATGDSYTIFYGPRPEFDAYLDTVAKKSDFIPHDVELDGQAHYLLLSTCAYSFENARTVLHGKLVPVPSVGGVPIDTALTEADPAA
ncbi:MAG: class B sortase [Eubacteriales bacterium]|nr:class B sortase [Eubacteriales bacterium]